MASVLLLHKYKSTISFVPVLTWYGMRCRRKLHKSQDLPEASHHCIAIAFEARGRAALHANQLLPRCWQELHPNLIVMQCHAQPEELCSRFCAPCTAYTV